MNKKKRYVKKEGFAHVHNGTYIMHERYDAQTVLAARSFDIDFESWFVPSVDEAIKKLKKEGLLTEEMLEEINRRRCVEEL